MKKALSASVISTFVLSTEAFAHYNHGIVHKHEKMEIVLIILGVAIIVLVFTLRGLTKRQRNKK